MQKFHSEVSGQHPHPDVNKESEQNQRILAIQELAREDAERYLKQHLTDFGQERILPSATPDLPWEIDSPGDAMLMQELLDRVAAKFGRVQTTDYEIYFEEFAKECKFGYPKAMQ